LIQQTNLLVKKYSYWTFAGMFQVELLAVSGRWG